MKKTFLALAVLLMTVLLVTGCEAKAPSFDGVWKGTESGQDLWFVINGDSVKMYVTKTGEMYSEEELYKELPVCIQGDVLYFQYGTAIISDTGKTLSLGMPVNYSKNMYSSNYFSSDPYFILVKQ